MGPSSIGRSRSGRDGGSRSGGDVGSGPGSSGAASSTRSGSFGTASLAGSGSLGATSSSLAGAGAAITCCSSLPFSRSSVRSGKCPRGRRPVPLPPPRPHPRLGQQASRAARPAGQRLQLAAGAAGERARPRGGSGGPGSRRRGCRARRGPLALLDGPGQELGLEALGAGGAELGAGDRLGEVAGVQAGGASCAAVGGEVGVESTAPRGLAEGGDRRERAGAQAAVGAVRAGESGARRLEGEGGIAGVWELVSIGPALAKS